MGPAGTGDLELGLGLDNSRKRKPYCIVRVNNGFLIMPPSLLKIYIIFIIIIIIIIIRTMKAL